MRKISAKHLMTGLFLLLLWLPMMQTKFHVFKLVELKGAYLSPSNISFNFKNWFEGSYVTQKEEFIRYNFGFRAYLVRLYNQNRFWLFKTTIPGLAVGKENFLYEEKYIDAYYGSDFVGEDNIQKRVGLLKELQDTLKEKGVFIFVTLAPGKGSFYPEYFPERLKRQKQTTNYERYIKDCKSAGVHVLDLKSYFLSLKSSSRYPLFPRCGMHWSSYGEFIAYDSLAHYVEKETGKSLPTLRLDSLQLTDKPRSRDYDAAEAMNLITTLCKDSLAYPFFTVMDSGKAKLFFLNIGDSYYCKMYVDYTPLVFKQHDFWYYFSTMYSPIRTDRKVDEVNLKEEILKHDIICLMYTDANLGTFGSGFIEKALQEFKSGKK
ncbi:MAG: hypothetical protein JWO06_1547 [Bacteroidota bacterium]|nr:hypothetical protein [Bacteroidota bacterium]